MSSRRPRIITGASDPGFDDIVDFFPEPCFAINLTGTVIAWNQAMVQLTGIEAFDMIGKGDYEYAIPFYGVRRPILIDLAINPDQEIAKKYKYVRKINDTLVSEIENVSMGDKSFYLWNTARKLCNAQGDCVGAIEVVRDITELKKTEDLGYRYDLLKKESRDIILFIDPEEGRIIEANDAAVRIYGYSHDELLSMSISDLRTTSNGDLVSNQITEAVVNGILFETEHRKKDGSAFPVEVSSKGATVGGGFLLISIIRDISLRKKAERALRQLNETLEQRVAKRTELAENRAKQLQALAVELVQVEERERRRVSHILHEDLQQILAAARFQLQAACQGMPPIPMLTCVERLLEESIEKSRRLSHELSPAVLYHYGLFSAMEWLVRQMAEQFGLEVRLEMEETRRFANATLEVFLFRAIQELLFNVVKHAGVRCANVFISRFNACLVATISDEGLGFEPDAMDSSTVKAGLGLVSLRERTHAMGGEFEIESAPGQGSRFTLTFPVTLIGEGEPRQPKLSAKSSPVVPNGVPDAACRTEARVLFVDDHEMIRQGLIGMIVDRPGIRVVGEAADGKEALEMFRRLKPDVVVMDVSMPVMDGIEATRRIKDESTRVRVIGLSMFQDKEIAQRMLQAGAEAFVTKSASSAELLKAIYGNDQRKNGTFE